MVGRLLADLPAQFAAWQPLAQDQYLEVRTLLSGYLLSSQGDRMLMAHSIEGRFPFLDKEVVELANSLPPRYKLSVLDEKHVLKHVARGLVEARDGGAHGRLLDADADRLGTADVQAFEMEELMPSKAAVKAVLG